MKMKLLLDTVIKVKEFCTLAQSFMHDIEVKTDRYTVDGKSLMGLFSLNLSNPVTIAVHEEDVEQAEMLFDKFKAK